MSQVGDPFQPFIYGQYNFPVKVALENNISVMMYGENGEVEYGGDMKYAFKPYNDFEARNKHYFSQFPLDIWKKYDLKEKDLNEFAAPSQADVLKKNIKLNVANAALRTVDFKGGLDKFLISAKNINLSKKVKKISKPHSFKKLLIEESIDFFKGLIL